MTFDEVINHFGSQAEVARKLECSKAYITKWKRDGYVPLVCQYQIKDLSEQALQVGKPFSISK